MTGQQLSLLTPAAKTPATISSFHPNEGQPLAEALAGEERARSQEEDVRSEVVAFLAEHVRDGQALARRVAAQVGA